MRERKRRDVVIISLSSTPPYLREIKCKDDRCCPSAHQIKIHTLTFPSITSFCTTHQPYQWELMSGNRPYSCNCHHFTDPGLIWARLRYRWWALSIKMLASVPVCNISTLIHVLQRRLCPLPWALPLSHRSVICLPDIYMVGRADFSRVDLYSIFYLFSQCCNAINCPAKGVRIWAARCGLNVNHWSYKYQHFIFTSQHICKSAWLGFFFFFCLMCLWMHMRMQRKSHDMSNYV